MIITNTIIIGGTSLTFRSHLTSSVSRDHLIPRRSFPIDGPLDLSLSLTVSEIFNGECDAMVDMNLNDL